MTSKDKNMPLFINHAKSLGFKVKCVRFHDGAYATAEKSTNRIFCSFSLIEGKRTVVISNGGGLRVDDITLKKFLAIDKRLLRTFITSISGGTAEVRQLRKKYLDAQKLHEQKLNAMLKFGRL